MGEATKVAIVTGGASGIGRAICDELARAGWTVAVADVDVERATAAANEIGAAGGRARAVAVDVTSLARAEAMAAEVVKELGGIGALVNCAGFKRFGPFAESDERRVLDLLQVNMTALTHLTRLALPGMIQRRWGRVVNLSSNAALQPGPLMAEYVASKAYVLSLSIALAEEVRGTGVRVTALCPGPTRSGFQRAAAMEDSRVVAGRELLVPGAVVTTDDRGAYRIPFVDPGRYVVAVLSVQATVPASTADGPRSLPLGGLQGRGQSGPPVSRTEANGASIDVDGRHRLVLTNFVTPPPPAADRARAYAPVFHPNARGVNDALAIEIDLGAGRGDIDFQLVPAPSSRISGRVTGSVQGAANMLLRLMAPGTEHLGFGSEVATTLVEADGTFTFINVPAGVYTLVAAPSVAEMSPGKAP